MTNTTPRTGLDDGPELPRRTAPLPRPEESPEWTCPRCEAVNRPIRELCRACGRANPNLEPDAAPAPETTAPQTEAPAEFWAILELMGHARMAGKVTEVQLAGKGFLRVDVPTVRRRENRWSGGETTTFIPPFSQLIAPDSIYRITPTTEANADTAAQQFAVRPLGEAEPAVVRQLEAAKVAAAADDSDSDDAEDDEPGF